MEQKTALSQHPFEKTQEQGFFRTEFCYGNFQRVILLALPIQNEQVKADFTNGILTLTLPKATEARRTVVKLNLAESTDTIAKLNAQADAETNNFVLN